MTKAGKYLKILVLVVCLLPLLATAQEDSAKSDFQRSFDEFLKSSQQDFEAFRNSNDSIFYQFLKEAWTEFDLFIDEKPATPKPKDQPEIEIEKIKGRKIEPVIRKTMLEDSGKQIQFHLAPNNYEEYKPAKKYNTIDFYGKKVDVFRIPEHHHWQAPVTKSSVADYFYEAVNNDDLVYTIYDLYNKASYNKLNNWGFIRLLQEASASLYTSVNEQVLFTWTALLKTGHDVRIGMQKDELFLLACFDIPVYYSQYLVKGNKKYYLVQFKGQDQQSESITSVKADYPGDLSPLSLVIGANPQVGNKVGKRKITFKGEKLELSYNENLASFYKDYPDCKLSVYFPPPLSKVALGSLDEALNPLLKNKTQVEKVNLLLDFLQHGMPYDTDDKQFGFENYLFAEETLHYPSIDCEDRTVLLSQLISHYLGLETLALAYPGHVTLAVQLAEAQSGSYVVHRGDRYYVCDPTYIGSRCGMLMPEFEDVNPEVITF